MTEPVPTKMYFEEPSENELKWFRRGVREENFRISHLLRAHEIRGSLHFFEAVSCVSDRTWLPSSNSTLFPQKHELTESDTLEADGLEYEDRA